MLIVIKKTMFEINLGEDHVNQYMYNMGLGSNLMMGDSDPIV